MRPLYAIHADLLTFDAMLDERGGDVSDPEALAFFEQWQATLVNEQALKLDGYIAYIKQLEMEATAAKAEAEQWQAKAAARQKRIEWLKIRLRDFLITTGQEKATTASGRTVAVTPNGGALPVILTADFDIANVPADYKTVTVVVDKEKVREALESGKELGFARLGERGCHVRIR